MEYVDYKISITTSALQDYHKAEDYIVKKLYSNNGAFNLAKGFRETIKDLKFLPTKYPLCKDSLLHTWGIRFVPVKNYLLFYIVREDEQKVYVIRFLYSKRNWQKILRNDIGNGGAEYAPIFKVPYVQEDVEKYGK